MRPFFLFSQGRKNAAPRRRKVSKTWTRPQARWKSLVRRHHRRSRSEWEHARREMRAACAMEPASDSIGDCEARATPYTTCLTRRRHIYSREPCRPCCAERLRGQRRSTETLDWRVSRLIASPATASSFRAQDLPACCVVAGIIERLT